MFEKVTCGIEVNLGKDARNSNGFMRFAQNFNIGRVSARGRDAISAVSVRISFNR
jgi:hypothetical protein